MSIVDWHVFAGLAGDLGGDESRSSAAASDAEPKAACRTPLDLLSCIDGVITRELSDDSERAASDGDSAAVRKTTDGDDDGDDDKSAATSGSARASDSTETPAAPPGENGANKKRLLESSAEPDDSSMLKKCRLELTAAIKSQDGETEKSDDAAAAEKCITLSYKVPCRRT